MNFTYKLAWIILVLMFLRWAVQLWLDWLREVAPENEVEIQNLSNGIYLIEVVTHQSQYCLKFLKSN